HSMSSLHRVTAVNSGTSFSIDPPLPADSYGEIKVYEQKFSSHNQLQYFGVEDLAITGEFSGNSSSAPLSMIRSYNCWLYNSRVEKGRGKIVNLQYSYQCEVRKCVIGGRTQSGSQGSGIFMERS